MSANAKCGVSLINLAVLLIAMTATGMTAVKVQKQGKDAEAYRLASEYANYAEAHFNLGVACLNLGDQKAAKVAYETLKTLDADLAGRLLKLISQ
jgi:hypothetical protein